MNFLGIALVSLTIILIPIIPLKGERGFQIVMNSYNCSFNPTYAIAHVCYLNKTLIPPQAFFDIQIQREISTVQYSWILFLIHNKSNSRRKLLHVKNTNACDFLVGMSAIPLLKIFRDILLEYGTMPVKCPLKKDSRFLFKNFIVDSEKFPTYLPETQFVVTVNLTTERNFVFAVTAAGKVTQKFNIDEYYLQND